MEGEGDSPVNLAEAAAHVLLEALHMHCQQGRTPAHHNGCVNTTTHFQVKSHNNGQVSTVTKYGAINGIIGQETGLSAAGQVAMQWQLCMGSAGVCFTSGQECMLENLEHYPKDQADCHSGSLPQFK